jgi:transketolase
MLVKNYLKSKKLKLDSTRAGFGRGLVEAAQKNKQIVALTADLSESTKLLDFEKKFPERYFDVGVAEQNLAGVAAGLALSGKIPFMTSYAVFSPGRNWDQIRVSIAYNQANVKIVSTHAGLNVGPDGATHQALEDIALMRVLPHMTVVVPADAEQARQATIACARVQGPVYLRLTRSSTPVFINPTTSFKIGQVQLLQTGTDVTLIACGPLVYQTLIAAHHLSQQGISATVINCHTIKPLDTKALLVSLKKTKAVVTIEEHQRAGGLGSAIAEMITAHYPVPQEFVAVEDTFGESGQADELLEKYGLTVERIIQMTTKVIKRKN